MGWEFDTDDFDPDRIDGFDVVADGRYHVQVDSVQEEGGKNQEMIVNFGVLSGTTAGQEGKNHQEYFSRSPKAAKRALLFACATGLTTIEELKKAKEANKNPVIDFTLAVGRQLCIEIVAEEYQGKMRPKIGFGIYSVDSPKAAGIPISQAAAAKAGDSPDPFGAPAGEGGSGGDDDIFG
jgi:hypothetical protein